MKTRIIDVNPGIGEFHGGFGSASFRECLGRVAQSSTTPCAPCRFGEGMGENVIRMTNPSQIRYRCGNGWRRPSYEENRDCDCDHLAPSGLPAESGKGLFPTNPQSPQKNAEQSLFNAPFPNFARRSIGSGNARWKGV